jgi:hypothetical protein
MYVCMYVLCVYVQWSQGEVQAAENLEPDRPHHDHPAVCILTQHLINTLLLSQRKNGLTVQNFVFQLLFAA